MSLENKVELNLIGSSSEGHIPVLLQEFLDLSVTKANDLNLWDGTLGLAGHSIAWLNKNKTAKVFGSDHDKEMLIRAKSIIEKKNILEYFTFKKGGFSEKPFGDILFDNIILDLGISSLHLDEFERGISFRFDHPLDMRMDTANGMPVSRWLNLASEYEIRKVLFEYGEEKKAPKIAREIVKNRPLETTFQLKKICEQVYERFGKKHKYTQRVPAVKTFQALRIFINDEIGKVKRAASELPYLLKENGRLFIISFHSLEDRIIKHTFRDLSVIKDDSKFAKSNFKPGDFKIITKHPIVASEYELEKNSRSRSAKMRVLERIKI